MNAKTEKPKSATLLTFVFFVNFVVNLLKADSKTPMHLASNQFHKFCHVVSPFLVHSFIHSLFAEVDALGPETSMDVLRIV